MPLGVASVGEVEKCPECGAENTIPDPAKAASVPPTAGGSPADAAILAELRSLNHTLNTRKKRQIQIPDYSSVKTLALIYRVLGGISAALGIFLIGLAFAGLPESRSLPEAQGVEFVGALVGGGAMILSGLILVGFGELFLCIRDSSRNSFYLKRIQ